MKTGIIYCATSPDGKKYYGRTIKFLSQRKGRHNYQSRNGSTLYFHNAIRKYGEENIKWEIVEKISEENLEILLSKLNEREEYFIKINNSLYPNGYNLTKGGSSEHITLSPRTGKNFEEIFGEEKAREIKAKQSKNNAHYWSGKTQSKTSIEKRTKANIGKKRTEQTKQKIANKLKGKTFTEDRKLHISDAHKGKTFFGKNFGPPKFGENHPNFIKITEELENKIIYLHLNNYLTPKQIAKIININGNKIIKFLRQKNVYLTFKELNRKKYDNI